MLLKQKQKRPPTFTPHAEDLASQGIRVFYHDGHTNFCPSCTRTAWYVGTNSAECANCSMVLEKPSSSFSSTRIIARRPKWEEFILRN